MPYGRGLTWAAAVLTVALFPVDPTGVSAAQPKSSKSKPAANGVYRVTVKGIT
ncbi:MAG: hypothetical protein ACE5KM_08060 [Planctomycetaceae bacterium]